MKNNFGVSFKGGAARGLGGIGVVRFLQENSLVPSVVAGSSTGALIASMYAMGFEWQKMLGLLDEISVYKFLSLGSLIKNGAFLSETAFLNIVLKHVKDINIEDLPIKLVIFATDLKKRERVYFTKGNLAHAIMASVAYPVIFPPYHYQGLVLGDGDLTNSFSCSFLKDMGAKKIIGVSYIEPTSPYFGRNILSKLLDLNRLLTYQVKQLSDLHSPPDINIEYKAVDMGYFDFKRAEIIAKRGYRAIEMIKKDIFNMLDY